MTDSDAMLRHSADDGSRPLRNTRHEMFCQYYTGEHRRNASASYKAAGYKTRSANVDACRLLTNSSIRRRIDYLNTLAMEQASIHARDAVERLSAIATASVSDYLDDKGEVDLAKVRDPRLAPAVESCDALYDRHGNLIGHRLKLHDPMRALELLGMTERKDESAGVNQVLVIKV